MSSNFVCIRNHRTLASRSSDFVNHSYDGLHSVLLPSLINIFVIPGRQVIIQESQIDKNKFAASVNVSPTFTHVLIRGGAFEILSLPYRVGNLPKPMMTLEHLVRFWIWSCMWQRMQTWFSFLITWWQKRSSEMKSLKCVWISNQSEMISSDC